MLIVLGNSLSKTLRRHFQAQASDKSAAALRLIPSSLGAFSSTEAFAEFFYKGKKPLPDFDGNKNLLAGQPVTIIQSTARPSGLHSTQLLLAVRTLKRYGAGQITVAMPFAAFARQDRTFDGRFCSVAGDDFPFFLKQAGADRVILQEVHSKAAEKFYTDHFGVDNVAFLSSTSLFAADLRAHASGPVVIGAPDGADKPGDAGQKRARDLAAAFLKAAALSPEQEKTAMFRISKIRSGPGHSKVAAFDGDVAGKTAVIVDDMTDSGGTVINAAKTLRNNGAADVQVYLTHALFNVKALKRILTETAEDGITPLVGRFVVTDTVPGIEGKIAKLEKEIPGIAKRLTVLQTGALLEKRILSFSPG